MRSSSAVIHRVAVLYSRLSGYTTACLRALKEQYGVELLVFRWPRAANAPFNDQAFAWIDHLYTSQGRSADEIGREIEAFQPDALLIAGWMDSRYLKVARQIRKRGIPVVAGCDTQWNGFVRQQIGRLIAPWYLHSAIDVLWVSGERQRQLAARLGYNGERCWSGYYACDWDRFAAVMSTRSLHQEPAFLYVGRYVAVKGIDVLVHAYQSYRSMVRTPWPLLCVGAGGQKHLLEGCEGIIDAGFVQPDDLPRFMRDASAFVLPSRREPWGVVMQEAAAAGLPLICSDACGAVVHLLQEGYNGFLFEAGNTKHLARCMARMTEAAEENLAEMGVRSHELSKQFTPARWADTLMQGIAGLQRAPDQMLENPATV